MRLQIVDGEFAWMSSCYISSWYGDGARGPERRHSAYEALTSGLPLPVTFTAPVLSRAGFRSDEI